MAVMVVVIVVKLASLTTLRDSSHWTLVGAAECLPEIPQTSLVLLRVHPVGRSARLAKVEPPLTLLLLLCCCREGRGAEWNGCVDRRLSETELGEPVRLCEWQEEEAKSRKNRV